ALVVGHLRFGVGGSTVRIGSILSQRGVRAENEGNGDTLRERARKPMCQHVIPPRESRPSPEAGAAVVLLLRSSSFSSAGDRRHAVPLARLSVVSSAGGRCRTYGLFRWSIVTGASSGHAPLVASGAGRGPAADASPWT